MHGGPPRAAPTPVAPPRRSPTHKAGDKVPERRPCSCPPPWSSGARLSAVAHPQAANALRPMDLVAGNGDQVRPVGNSASGQSPGRRRTASARPSSCASRANSAIGWMTPISLLTSMTATMAVLSSITASAMSRSTSPSLPTWRRTTSTPFPSSHSAVSSTAACSVATVTSLRRLDSLERPLSAQFSASVAPRVKANRPPARPMRLFDLASRHFDRRRGLAAPARRASADWRISPRSTAASPPPLRAPPASSPDSRGRSCRPLCARSRSAPFGKEGVDLGFARLRAEADAEEAAGDRRVDAHRRQNARFPSSCPIEQALPAETAMPARSNCTSSDCAGRARQAKPRRSSAAAGCPRR